MCHRIYFRQRLTYLFVCIFFSFFLFFQFFQLSWDPSTKDRFLYVEAVVYNPTIAKNQLITPTAK